MSYWTFSDWGFEEQGVDPLPWNPGQTKFGILTNEAVPKPAYRGLHFISQAAGDATMAAVPAEGGRLYPGRTAAVAATRSAMPWAWRSNPVRPRW